MIEKKRTPFDLRRALLGEKIETRKGVRAEFITYRPTAHQIIVQIGNRCHVMDENGKVGVAENSYDLFMAKTIVRRSVWTRHYYNEAFDMMSGISRESKDSKALTDLVDNDEELEWVGEAFETVYERYE